MNIIHKCLLSVLAVGASCANVTFAADEKVTYADHVLPIFRAKCNACHNPDKKSGGLDLTNYTSMMQGGSSGAVIESGDIDSSHLWSVVNHDSQPYMPPNSDKLPAELLSVIKKWIEGGALETKSSTAAVKKKAKMEVSLSFAPNGRPEGPAPMPERLSLQPTVVTPMTTTVYALATNPWSPLVAVSGQRQILLYNSQTLQISGVIPFPEGIPRVLRFSRSGQLLLAAGGKASASGKVVVFNVKTGDRVIEVGDELDEILAADMSADQKYVALGGPAKMVRIYSTATGEKLFDIKKHTDWVTAMHFSPDGVLLATGDRNGGVFVWEAETGREYLGLRGHGAAITGFGWRSDSNVLASVSEDTTCRTWELENGNQLKSWGAHGGGASGVWFTREGQIATVGRDRVAKLWDQNGTAIRQFEAFGDLALQVAYCDETKRLIAGDWTGLVRVWNAADGARLGELSTNPPTLESRLALATAEVTRLQGVAKQTTDGYAALLAAANQVAANLDASQKKVVELTQAVQADEQKVVTSKATAVDAQGKLDAANKIVAALAPVVPGLKESVAKSAEVGAKAPGDAELTAAVNQLKAVLAARETSLVNSMKAVTDETARLKAAQELTAATEKLVVDGKAAIEANKKLVEQYTAALPVEQKKATDAKAVADQATAAANAAQADVTKWQTEIAFAAKLAAFRTKQSEVDQLVAAFDESAAELAKMQQAVKDAQGELAKAQQQETAAANVVNEAKQKLAAVVTQRDALTKQVADIDAALPMIKTAWDKAIEAAKLAPNDKELAAAAEQLKAAFERNTKTSADGKTQLVEYGKQLEAAQAVVAGLEPKVIEAKTAVAKANEQVVAKTAAMKPAEEKSAAAKQTAETARAALGQIQQELNTLKPSQQASVAIPAKPQG